MRVPDEVRQCVVFVGLPSAPRNGQVGLLFKGTAFFVSVPSETVPEVSHVFLVTAKHVAASLASKPFLVRANTKDGKSAIIPLKGTRWWYHPTDLSVDVAVIPWAPPEHVEYTHYSKSAFLTDEIISSKRIGTGDEVFITGLFAHLTGSSRDLPIVRMGNVAMLPEEPVPTSIGNIEAYLIEARSIGGLSGSPAFVVQTTPPEIGTFYLLGLMHGHWDIPPMAKNDQVMTDGDEYRQVNMGIAIVIPAKEILEVINQTGLAEARKRRDEQLKKERTPTSLEL